MHKYFILDTTSCECSELCPFAGLEALDRFNQTDCPDANQVLEILTRIVEFFDVVDTT